MSILLQKKNVGDYSYMSSPNIYYRAFFMEGAYEKRVGNIGGWKRSFQLAMINYE